MSPTIVGYMTLESLRDILHDAGEQPSLQKSHATVASKTTSHLAKTRYKYLTFEGFSTKSFINLIT